MFDRMGDKIKTLTKSLFWIETIIIVLVGFGFADYTGGASVLLSFVGVIFAYISSFVLYGFGEIICKLTEIEQHTRYSYRDDT